VKNKIDPVLLAPCGKLLAAAAIIFITLMSFLTGCSSGRFFISPELPRLAKNIDTVSIITDGVVFNNSNVVFLDISLSNAYSIQSSNMAYQILRKRGFKIGQERYSIIGTFLPKDSMILVLPQGKDSVVYQKPPIIYRDSYQIDYLFLNSQIRITRFLDRLNFRINDKVRFPDTLADDLIAIRKKMKSRYLCLSYFSGLCSDMISQNTKIIWTAASLFASGGIVSVTPHRYSQISHTVFLMDLDSGRLLFAYENSFFREKRFLELLGISWNDRVQWQFPCKSSHCEEPSIFYNPFEKN
jgi:hypothetical protein